MKTEILSYELIHVKVTMSTAITTSIVSNDIFLLHEKDYTAEVNSLDTILSVLSYLLHTYRTQISRGVVYFAISIEEEHIL